MKAACNCHRVFIAINCQQVDMFLLTFVRFLLCNQVENSQVFYYTATTDMKYRWLDFHSINLIDLKFLLIISGNVNNILLCRYVSKS